MFTDRIEISNPGGLYGTVTHEVLSNPHQEDAPALTSTRNQFLFTLLESTPYPDGGFVNPEGTDGYRRISTVLLEHGMEPASAKNSIGRFTITINKHTVRSKSSPEAVSKSIVTLLEAHSAMSAKEIVRELRLTPLAATSVLHELLREGRVTKVRHRGDPTPRYRLS